MADTDMRAPARVLLAVDGSEAARKATEHLADLARKGLDLEVLVFHVLPPLPPELLEFRGAEDSSEEMRLDAEVEAAQTRWRAGAEAAARPIFEEARSLLVAAGIAPDRVAAEFGEPPFGSESLADRILNKAVESGSGTIAVGRGHRGRLGEMLHTHVCHQLIGRADGVALLVVQ